MERFIDLLKKRKVKRTNMWEEIRQGVELTYALK